MMFSSRVCLPTFFNLVAVLKLSNKMNYINSVENANDWRRS